MTASTDSLRQPVKQMRVLHAYTAQHDDELTIRPGKISLILVECIFGEILGDIITLLERRSDQWCKGNLNGNIGLFPGNFAQDI
jgi:hypothetical protein